MVNTLYRLDLDEMRWSRLTPTTKPKLATAEPSLQQPQPRYFHSADLWNNKIIFFGGMGYSHRSQDAGVPGSAPTEELCVLDELLALDLTTQQWDYTFDVASPRAIVQHDPSSSSQPDTQRPAPRYAHLSALSGDTLSIIGGQNLANQYVESINLFSLSQNRWIGAQRFQKQCGSYRSLAVGAKCLHKDGQKAKCYPRAKDPLNNTDTGNATPMSNTSTPQGNQSAEKLTGKVEQNPLPMSCPPAPDQSLPVYLYSNYNFTDVRRELEVLAVQPDAATNQDTHRTQQRRRSGSNASQESAIDIDGPLTPSQANAATAAQSSLGALVSIDDRSNHMGGVTLPPGLRFPTGALLGPYLLISGTYLANATQSFSVWALHLPTMVWSRIESGSALSTGSWNRALLWPAKNRLVVVGHKERDLVSDYNHRQTNWDHVVVLELEAWGIYQPPYSGLSDDAVQLGLDKLAATAPSAMASAQALARGAEAAHSLAEERVPGASAAEMQSNLEKEVEALNLGGRGDFEIVCSDGLRIGCDRAILEARWPWFRSKMDEYRRRARRTLRIAYPTSQEQSSLGIIPEDIAEFLAEEDDEEEALDPPFVSSANKVGAHDAKQKVRDPRFQPRHLQISEPLPVVLALLQFVYTLRICTALQRHPAVVCALMVLAKTYNMDSLASWARHAAHVALADDLHPKAPSTLSRHGDMLSPSSSITHALDSFEHSSLDLFRPSESLGLHPEERHRLAVCLYEAASLCGCEGLQIRALRVVMAIARWLQKHGAGPNAGSGSGSGLEKQAQGRSEGSTHDRSGSASQSGAGSNGVGSAHSSANQFRAGSGSTFRAATGGFSSVGPSPLLPLPLPSPSPSPSLSRAGSDAASSHGPLTPNSTYQSFSDRRGDSFSSSSDAPASDSALVYLSGEVESLDDQPSTPFRKMSFGNSFSSGKTDKYTIAITSPDVANRSTDPMPSGLTLVSSEVEASDAQAPSFARKRRSLFGRNTTSNTPILPEVPTMEPVRAGSSLGFHSSTMADGTVLGDLNAYPSNTLPDRRASASASASASAHVTCSTKPVSPTTTTGDDWSSGFHLARHSMPLRDGKGASVTSLALNSPALTMDPNRRYMQASAASSPAREQFPVNSYGPRSEQEQVSRSTSVHSLSTDTSLAASLHRSNSGASHHQSSTPLDGIEISRDVTHLSSKEIAMLNKKERKRIEKEEKERKKAEKAEYKRLAAEAVFGPKGSAGPSPALPSSDFAMYTSGAQAVARQGTGAQSSRRSSEPSDSRSSTSTASPRTGSSLRTAYSPRTPAPTAPPKRGEWAVATATSGGPWFSAPPPMMAPPSLKGMPKGNRSAASLSGQSSPKTRLTS